MMSSGEHQSSAPHDIEQAIGHSDEPRVPEVERCAYLVLAHRNPARLARLARAIRVHSPDADVLIAFNGSLDAAEARMLSEAGAARVGTGRRAGWGSFSLVERMLEGLEAARGHAWVTVVSGEDYPAADLRAWEAWLRALQGVAVLSARQVGPREADVLDRTRFRWFIITPRSPTGRLALRIVGRLLPAAVKHRVAIFDGHCCVAYRRGIQPKQVWKGSQWMALSRAGAAYVLAAGRDPRWRRSFRRSLVPDESFVQTILATSGLPWEAADVSFTRWGATSPHPDELGPEDIDAVLAAGTPFARKLTGPQGDALADLLDRARRSHPPPGTS